jgi:hypothetical protein
MLCRLLRTSLRFTHAFALDSSGRPIFLISNMAMHTQNLKADSRSSLFVGQAGADKEALGTALGNPDRQIPNRCLRTMQLAFGRKYLARQRTRATGLTSLTSASFGSSPLILYYVGGFGVMGWVPAHDYEHAARDPRAEAAPGIIAHMNADHVDAMTLPESCLKR